MHCRMAGPDAMHYENINCTLFALVETLKRKKMGVMAALVKHAENTERMPDRQEDLVHDDPRTGPEDGESVLPVRLWKTPCSSN